MEKPTEILEKVAISLEKYKKNKTLVSPEDLAGKYKAPFQKLKAQLASELSEYLKAYSLDGLKVVQDNNLEGFTEVVNRIYIDTGMGKRVGKAAFKDFDLEQVKQLAEELRSNVYEQAWVPYFQRYTCLYLTEECLADKNPQAPRIYNSLVDKFFNVSTGEWITETTREQATLMYISRREL